MSFILPLDDVTGSAIQRALDGVATSQRVTADNIANATTPNFRARTVRFEASLARAIADGRPGVAEISEVPTGGPVKLDGNDVDLQTEFGRMGRDGLSYQALVQAFNFKANILRTALSRS